MNMWESVGLKFILFASWIIIVSVHICLTVSKLRSYEIGKVKFHCQNITFISLPKYYEMGLTCVSNWPPARKELRFAWTIFNIIWFCYFTWYSWKKKERPKDKIFFWKRCAVCYISFLKKARGAVFKITTRGHLLVAQLWNRYLHRECSSAAIDKTMA